MLKVMTSELDNKKEEKWYGRKKNKSWSGRI
jgi:hypothetical protein